MRQVARIATAGGIGAETIDGKFHVAVFTVHFITLLFISFFGMVAGVTGVKGYLDVAVLALDRKEGDLLASVG